MRLLAIRTESVTGSRDVEFPMTKKQARTYSVKDVVARNSCRRVKCREREKEWMAGDRGGCRLWRRITRASGQCTCRLQRFLLRMHPGPGPLVVSGNGGLAALNMIQRPYKHLSNRTDWLASIEMRTIDTVGLEPAEPAPRPRKPSPTKGEFCNIDPNHFGMY